MTAALAFAPSFPAPAGQGTRYMPYWQDTAAPFAGGAQGPATGRFDAAVIGGGFTGLAAARKLALRGMRVAVLEAGSVGAGASGRNGGHVNNGLAHSYLAASEAWGPETAAALYRAFDAAVDTVERVIGEEGIACDFRRSGKLKLAAKPSHYEGLARNYEAMRREVDTDLELLGPGDLSREIGSGAFHGGLVMRRSAQMHMKRYSTGLAAAAVRHGATIWEDAPVTGLRARDGGHAVVTARGTIQADRVLLATGASTAGPFAWLRRRIVPVGSFIIATRPLSASEVDDILPGRRNCTTSLNVGNYFRLSPDDRLIFGGRARFTASIDPRKDAQACEILQAALAEIFPQLAGIGIDYCWGGIVDMTRDRLPRAGRRDGVWHAMGYSGHGAQMATHLGEIMAEEMAGGVAANPFAGLPWKAVPGHFGKPWFLPAVGLYYRALDRLG
jgi:glycine/D-amino acid oxidase-like deaminating enzyme